MYEKSRRCSCGVGLDCGPRHAYDEEAFRHLLAIERKRAEHFRSSFLLLLVSVKTHLGNGHRIPPVAAAGIFRGLGPCIREVDFMGWFREGRVAGAVLTQGREAPAPDVSRRIGERITGTLSERLPAPFARSLHVRVLQLRPKQQL